jgi:hypothetical protein
LGVPAGATRPHQVSMAKPGKLLDSGGTPGSRGWRPARSRPAP